MSTVANMTSSSSQQFCLKWNNHTTNFIKTLNEMINEESFVDVTLACEGSSLKAHKMVLSACSNYFKELFLSNPCSHPIVILKDMKIEDLKAIIDFMYKGEVNVSQNQLGALLKTAEILKVKGLTEVSDEADKNLGERKNGPLVDDMPGVSSNIGTNPSLSSTTTPGRKKKRRRTRKGTGGSSGDDASASDSGPSSEDDETVDVPALKRGKESNQSLMSQTHQHPQQLQQQQQQQQQQQPQHQQQQQQQSQPSQHPHQPNIPDPTSNVMQTRRRALQLPQVPQGLTQVQNQLPSQQRDGIENSSDGHMEDSSEAWVQGQQLALARPVTDVDDDESDEVIDVKPIVSFDEGSMGSMCASSVNNSVAMTSDCLVNQMDVGGMSPGTQTSTSGKICVCHLCHLTFTAYSSLRRHMQRHYADRERYECDICLKSYSRKDYLKEHKKLKHTVG